MLSGGLAGASTTIIGYPMDFARTRLAVDIGRKKKDREFTGMLDCMRKVARADGVSGLYRGVAISLPAMVLYRGCYFGLYDTGKQWMFSDKPKLWERMLLAQTVSSLSNIAFYPLDTVRRRLMMQAAQKKILYTSALDAAQKMMRHEGGVKALYKGGLTNMIRASGGALVLVVYDVLKDYLKK